MLYQDVDCSPFSALSLGKPHHSFHPAWTATKGQKLLLYLNPVCHATFWKTVQQPHPRPAVLCSSEVAPPEWLCSLQVSPVLVLATCPLPSAPWPCWLYCPDTASCQPLPLSFLLVTGLSGSSALLFRESPGPMPFSLSYRDGLLQHQPHCREASTCWAQIHFPF